MDENTYIFDVESLLEMVRLIDLDRFTTQVMGGPLAGLPDLSTALQLMEKEAEGGKMNR